MTVWQICSEMARNICYVRHFCLGASQDIDRWLLCCVCVQIQYQNRPCVKEVFHFGLLLQLQLVTLNSCCLFEKGCPLMRDRLPHCRLWQSWPRLLNSGWLKAIWQLPHFWWLTAGNRDQHLTVTRLWLSSFRSYRALECRLNERCQR